MAKKSGIVLVATGAVLVLAALLLFLGNEWESRRAGQASERLAEELVSMVETLPAPTEGIAPTEATLSPDLPIVEIDGRGYVGYLEVPTLDLRLPVLAEWSNENLQIAPCREFGSSRTDDLIIAAHNYSTHFGKLKNLTPGAVVTFTDMEGIQNTYTVAETFTLDPTQSETVYATPAPLALYTCTPGGEYRQVVLCKRVEK